MVGVVGHPPSPTPTAGAGTGIGTGVGVGGVEAGEEAGGDFHLWFLVGLFGVFGVVGG